MTQFLMSEAFYWGNTMPALRRGREKEAAYLSSSSTARALQKMMDSHHTPPLEDIQSCLALAKNAVSWDQLAELGELSRRLLSHFFASDPRQLPAVIAMVTNAYGGAANCIAKAELGKKMVTIADVHSLSDRHLFPPGAEPEITLLAIVKFFAGTRALMYARWIGRLPDDYEFHPSLLTFNWGPSTDERPASFAR